MKLLVIFLMLLMGLNGLIFSQNALTIEELEGMKYFGYKEEEILEEVEKKGLNFDINKTSFLQLRRKGFSGKFIRNLGLLAKKATLKFPPIPKYLLQYYQERVGTPEIKNICALVMGVNTYQNLPKLKFAVNDAEGFTKHLLSMGVPPKQICLLTDNKMSREEWNKAIQTLTNFQGTVYIFYSGHGIPAKEGFYFTVPDTDMKNLKSTAVSMKDCREQLEKTRAKQVVLFVDACHSGQIKDAEVEFEEDDSPNAATIEIASCKKPIAIFTSCQGDQVSREGKGLGLFTESLLDGLLGKADRDKDSRVNTRELFRYVRDEVEEKSNYKQCPQFSFSQAWQRMSDPGVPLSQAKKEIILTRDESTEKNTRAEALKKLQKKWDYA